MARGRKAKLDEASVVAIRADTSSTLAALAEIYGVSIMTIHKVKKGLGTYSKYNKVFDEDLEVA